MRPSFTVPSAITALLLYWGPAGAGHFGVIWFTKRGYQHQAYASGVLWNIRGNLSAAVSARLLDLSGCKPVYDQAHQAIVPYVVGHFPEWITARRHRAS